MVSFGVSTMGTFRFISVRGHNVFDVELWFDKDFAFFIYRSRHHYACFKDLSNTDMRKMFVIQTPWNLSVL